MGASAVPTAVPYTALLTTDAGAAYGGTVSVTAALYEVQNPTPGVDAALWGPHDFGSLPVLNGILHFALGAAGGPALDSAVLAGASGPVYVLVTLDGTPMLPAQRLLSVPYALVAEDATAVGGVPADEVAHAGNLHALLAANPGSVRLGNDAAACDSTKEGTLRWNGSAVQVCDGADWVGLGTGGGFTDGDGLSPLTAGVSCKTILDGGHSYGNGLYWINPEGNPNSAAAYQAFCDMTDDGGGWTLVYVIINGVTSPAGTGAVTPANLNQRYPSSPGKLSDAHINLLSPAGEYRYEVGTLGYKRFFLLSHPFANSTGQVTNGDKCRVSIGAAWVDITTGASTTNYGLSSTPSGDGCGPCVDRCGGPSGEGFWHSWQQYFGTTSNNGAYTKVGGLQYTNGYMWAR